MLIKKEKLPRNRADIWNHRYLKNSLLWVTVIQKRRNVNRSSLSSGISSSAHQHATGLSLFLLSDLPFVTCTRKSWSSIKKKIDPRPRARLDREAMLKEQCLTLADLLICAEQSVRSANDARARARKETAPAVQRQISLESRLLRCDTIRQDGNKHVEIKRRVRIPRYCMWYGSARWAAGYRRISLSPRSRRKRRIMLPARTRTKYSNHEKWAAAERRR